MKVLFLCKKWIDTYGKCYGLINSASFVVNMLNENKIEAKLETLVDYNAIDKAVSLYKPSHVIIEAIWVLPSKFLILMKLHPKVKWIVRIHSKIPFLAMEGIAMEWIQEYSILANKYKNFNVSFNVDTTNDEINEVYNSKAIYLPNVYYPKDDKTFTSPLTKKDKNKPDHKKYIDIGCFGAIRPLKNQLIQAVAAIHFANKIDKKLKFHINATREEQQGQNVLKNIRSLFSHDDGHILVEHGWMSHLEFITMIKETDLGMQVSFSESFNIVAADYVWSNVPIVTSPEISWMSNMYKCDPNSVDSIVTALNFAYKMKGIGLQYLNLRGLKKFNEEATDRWLHFLRTF